MLCFFNAVLYNDRKGGSVMDIGSNIQFHRKRLGLSQEDLGQKLLVSRQTISLWEKCQTLPTLDNLLRLKEIFGISLDELCNCTESVQAPVIPTAEYRIAPDDQNLREIYRFIGRPNLHRFIITIAIYIATTLLIISNEEASLPGLWVLLLLICIVGRTLRFFMNRKAVRKPWKTVVGNQYVYQLFEDYFLALCFRGGEQISSVKHYYCDIKKFHHTKQLLILQTGDTFHVLPNDALSEGSPLHTELKTNPSKKAPGPNIIIWKTVSVILVVASLAAAFGAVVAVSTWSSSALLDLQNMWIFFLFLPVPAASIVFGAISKRKGYPQRKNIVIGIIVAVWLFSFGCFSFIFSGFINDDPTPVYRAEEILNIDLPDYEAIQTTNTAQAAYSSSRYFEYYHCEVYFERDGAREFAALVENDERFLQILPNELIGISSFMYGQQLGDYVLLYNVDTNQFNTQPEENGTYRFVCIEYMPDQDRMLIVEYDIDYVK